MLLLLPLLLAVMLRPHPPRPLAEPHGPDIFHAVRLVDQVGQVGAPQRVPALGGRPQALEVVPAVDVAVFDAPIEVRLDVAVFVVRDVEGYYFGDGGEK